MNLVIDKIQLKESEKNKHDCRKLSLWANCSISPVDVVCFRYPQKKVYLGLFLHGIQRKIFVFVVMRIRQTWHSVICWAHVRHNRWPQLRAQFFWFSIQMPHSKSGADDCLGVSDFFVRWNSRGGGSGGGSGGGVIVVLCDWDWDRDESAGWEISKLIKLRKKSWMPKQKEILDLGTVLVQ